MLRPILLGVLLGAIFGAAVGATPRPQLGIPFWTLVLAATGGFQAWAGHWILAQSSDVPKMRAALPLSGAVVASLICVFTGEGFFEPVLASFLVGVAVSRYLAR